MHTPCPCYSYPAAVPKSLPAPMLRKAHRGKTGACMLARLALVAHDLPPALSSSAASSVPRRRAHVHARPCPARTTSAFRAILALSAAPPSFASRAASAAPAAPSHRPGHPSTLQIARTSPVRRQRRREPRFAPGECVHARKCDSHVPVSLPSPCPRFTIIFSRNATTGPRVAQEESLVVRAARSSSCRAL